MSSSPYQRKPRRGGRPQKEEAERRTQYVGFWVTDGEHAAIMARAAQTGSSSVSAFARAAALGARIPAARVSQHSPEVVAQLRRIGNNLNQCLYEARIERFPPDLAAATEEAIRDVSAALRLLIHGPQS